MAVNKTFKDILVGFLIMWAVGFVSVSSALFFYHQTYEVYPLEAGAYIRGGGCTINTPIRRSASNMKRDLEQCLVLHKQWREEEGYSDE